MKLLSHRQFFVALLLMPLCACALIGHVPAANELYILKPSASVAEGKPVPGSIGVILPAASPGLDTARIAVIESPNRLTYYNSVAWAKPLPQMVQVFLAESLQQSQLFKSVSSDNDGVYADVNLVTAIGDFAVDAPAANPTVQLRLVARLVNANSHKTIATFPIEKTVTAAANHMPDIAAAFNEAMNQAAAELVQDITISCAKAHACVR